MYPGVAALGHDDGKRIADITVSNEWCFSLLTDLNQADAVAIAREGDLNAAIGQRDFGFCEDQVLTGCKCGEGPA